MSYLNALASEEWAIFGGIDPAALSGTSRYSDTVDLTKFRRAVFILMRGSEAGVIDMAAYQSAAASAESASVATDGVAITSYAITQLAAGTTDVQCVLEVGREALTDGYAFVQVKLTEGGTASTTCAVIAIGVEPVFWPGADDDATSVQEIINLADI